MLWVTAGLMGVSTVISSYSVVSDRPLAAFITALLPAIAAADWKIGKAGKHLLVCPPPLVGKPAHPTKRGSEAH